jgi:hypothetical protein
MSLCHVGTPFAPGSKQAVELHLEDPLVAADRLEPHLDRVLAALHLDLALRAEAEDEVDRLLQDEVDEVAACRLRLRPCEPSSSCRVS